MKRKLVILALMFSVLFNNLSFGAVIIPSYAHYQIPFLKPGKVTMGFAMPIGITEVNIDNNKQVARPNILKQCLECYVPVNVQVNLPTGYYSFNCILKNSITNETENIVLERYVNQGINPYFINNFYELPTAISYNHIDWQLQYDTFIIDNITKIG